MIYALLGKFLYRFGGFIHGPAVDGTERARIVLINGTEILLIKNWIGSGGWKLPGGGVKKGEDPKAALIRELQEELNIKLDPNSLKFLFKEKVMRNNSGYMALCFSANLPDKAFKRNKLEITDAEWFSATNLPKNTDYIIKKCIKALELAL